MRSLSVGRVRVAAVSAVAAALAAVVTLSAQTPGQTRGVRPPAPTPRDTRGRMPPGTASISGTVVVAGTGIPGRHARVVLAGLEPRGTQTTAADDAGRFAFTGLAAGRYNLSASKPGYVTIIYGQRQPGPGRPGTPIQLADGQELAVQLQMPRGAVISGTVLDEQGEAVPGTLVRAYRAVVQGGVRSMQQAGSDATDDRGIYRIYGLQPGEYVIGATPRSGPGATFDRVEIVDGRGGRGRVLGNGPGGGLPPGAIDPGDEPPAEGYAPIFYPGTPLTSNATPVPAAAGEEKLGVDFQLQLAPMATLEGLVIAPAGAASGVVVRLINTGDDIGGSWNSFARPVRDGAFQISGVPPGHYTLVARASVGGPRAGRGGRGGREGGPAADFQRLWAQTEVTVDGRRLSNLVLTLQPGFTVTGRVEFHGTTSPPPPSGVRVVLEPAETTSAGRELAMPASGTMDDSGRFTVTGVVPGRYRLNAFATGWHLETATIGGQDAIDVPVEVRTEQGLSGVVTLTDRDTSLSGTVTNDRGQPLSDYMLIVYPSDARYWLPQARRIRAVRPDTDGSFTIAHLPPGEYRLAPVLDPEPGAWFDPAFLQQIDAAAMSITLGEGEQKVQHVRLAGA